MRAGGGTKAVLGKIQADPSLLASDPSYCRLQFSTHLFNCAPSSYLPGAKPRSVSKQNLAHSLCSEILDRILGFGVLCIIAEHLIIDILDYGECTRFNV